MKRILKLNKITLLTLFVLALGCKDESLDPFRLNEVKKGSILALRGDDGKSGSLDPDQNFFFKDNVQAGDDFHYVADFISEDQSLLESIQVFARVGTGARVPVATVSGSNFVVPTGGNSRQGEVRVSLSAIFTALGITNPTTLVRTDLTVESDIILTDGTTVPAGAIVNTGLFAAAAFFPAHTLNYYAEVTADFLPVATTKLAGEVVKNAAGAVTSRPVFPLKSGAKDTLFVTYNQDITNTPTFTYTNAIQTNLPVGVTGSGVVKKNATTFFEVITANPGFTGAVTATITGANSVDFIPAPGLTQVSKTQTINVDNLGPQVSSSSTGTRIGKGQLATITLNFNEAMSAKTANVIKITIDDPNDKLKEVTAQNMTLAANGLSASYVFLFELVSASDPAIHETLNLTYTGGADLAGNAPVSLFSAGLTIDVGTPLAPTLTLAGDYDQGTQIKWSGTQTAPTMGPNPGGAVVGTIYFVAVTAGEAKPTGVTFDADAVATWTMAVDATPPAGAAAGALVVNRQQGTLTTLAALSGGTGVVFTPFTANNSTVGLDIYAVFVGTTGNVSMIPVTPQLAAVIML